MHKKWLLSGIVLLVFIASSGTRIFDKDSKATGGQGVSPVTIFLCGDVMLGRGIDQILAHPGDPAIHETFMKSAEGYVEIAERKNGSIPRGAGDRYIWGVALGELADMQADLRIINLETSITKSDDYWKNKGINYRMHPDNIACLTAVPIDFCALANNHILDWGFSGLQETLETLNRANVQHAGAGMTLQEAENPAIFHIDGKCRVLVFSCGMASSGIPPDWSATEDRPGVNLFKDLSERTVQRIKEKAQEEKREGDIVIVSIHWGSNWGYDISADQSRFAHQLIDEAGVSIIHGHSSHHVKGIEVYKERAILYGCGDFLNDYEGIGGHEQYRSDLSLMYFVSVDPQTGELSSLRLVPTQIKHFRVNKASRRDALWLKKVLSREGSDLGTSAELQEDNSILLHWD